MKSSLQANILEGTHLSVSLIAGQKPLPLTVNRQFIEFIRSKSEIGSIGQKAGVLGIKYNGSQTPYPTPKRAELYETAIFTAKCLKCSGYVGIDMVLADIPYVVDVNPRPTASLFGISRVMREELETSF